MRQSSSDVIKAGGDLAVNIDSFGRHIRAENLSPQTFDAYAGATKQFHRYSVDQGMPLEVAGIRREHVEMFITDLLERWKPATANNRFRGVKSFFKWAVSKGEIRESPMAQIKPPRIPENPPSVLREAELKALLATCERQQDFESRRDAALIRVLIDTGGRLSEIANLRWYPPTTHRTTLTWTRDYYEFWAKDAGSASWVSDTRRCGHWTGTSGQG